MRLSFQAVRDYFRIAGDPPATCEDVRNDLRKCLDEWVADFAPVDAAHNIAKRKLATIFPNCLLVPQGCHRIDAERASGCYQGSQNRDYSE
jgi:hypothetical protein